MFILDVYHYLLVFLQLILVIELISAHLSMYQVEIYAILCDSLNFILGTLL